VAGDVAADHGGELSGQDPRPQLIGDLVIPPRRAGHAGRGRSPAGPPVRRGGQVLADAPAQQVEPVRGLAQQLRLEFGPGRQLRVALDPDVLTGLVAQPSALGDAVQALAAAVVGGRLLATAPAG